jgi:hypothetical protein
LAVAYRLYPSLFLHICIYHAIMGRGSGTDERRDLPLMRAAKYVDVSHFKLARLAK